MSRNDRRRGGRNRNWSNRDNNNEKNERQKSPEARFNERSERSEKNHESRGSGSYERRQERRRLLNSVSQKEIEESRNAIKAFKEHVVNCEICGEPIQDLANAISNKGSDSPVHFDCVIQNSMKLKNQALMKKLLISGRENSPCCIFQTRMIKNILQSERQLSGKQETPREVTGATKWPGFSVR